MGCVRELRTGVGEDVRGLPCSNCWRAALPLSPRASGHRVAGPFADAAARAPHLVPGRRAYLQQHAGLRALVPPGTAPWREAGQVSAAQGRGRGGTGPEEGAGLGEGWSRFLLTRDGRRGFSPPPRPSHSAPEVRVLLFNSIGDRDPTALLKLLQVRDWLMGGQQAAQH